MMKAFLASRERFITLGCRIYDTGSGGKKTLLQLTYTETLTVYIKGPHSHHTDLNSIIYYYHLK